MKLVIEIERAEINDLLLALEDYGLQVSAEDVVRVARLRNKIRVAADLAPESIWEDETEGSNSG